MPRVIDVFKELVVVLRELSRVVGHYRDAPAPVPSGLFFGATGHFFPASAPRRWKSMSRIKSVAQGARANRLRLERRAANDRHLGALHRRSWRDDLGVLKMSAATIARR
jgi:hypothetical protein